MICIIKIKYYFDLKVSFLEPRRDCYGMFSILRLCLFSVHFKWNIFHPSEQGIQRL